MVFPTPYPAGTNYAVVITGGTERNFGYTNKTVNGFTIDSGAAAAFSSEVSWGAVPIGAIGSLAGRPMGLLLAITYAT